MEEYFDFVNKRSDAYKRCKFVRATFNDKLNTLEVVMVYPEDFLFTVDMKNKLYEITREYVDDPKIEIKLVIKKSYFDSDVIKNFVTKYLQNNFTAFFATLSNNWIDIDVVNHHATITLYSSDAYIKYLNERNFVTNLVSELDKIFFGDFDIILRVDPKLLSDSSIKIQEELMDDDSMGDDKQYYHLDDVKTLVGNKITGAALAINCIDENMEKVLLCGKISYLAVRSFKPKKDEKGEKGEKKFYTFSLNDDTGYIHCSIFETKSNEKKLPALKDGMTVAVLGVLDIYRGNYCVKVHDISLCKPTKIEREEESGYHEIRDKYLFVKPEPYENKQQADLFNIFETPSVSPVLANNDIVVYDLETTGLNPDVDNIIEIGAVKVHSGRISETFSTLINPGKAIPEEVTKVNNITNEMVADKLPIEKVLPDFMRFVNGCIIAGYNNTNFDDKFLRRVCKKCRYELSNKSVDVFNLARANVVGARNYKLITIAEKLGVTLDNAHRALFDTIATADVLIKLADHLEI